MAFKVKKKKNGHERGALKHAKLECKQVALMALSPCSLHGEKLKSVSASLTTFYIHFLQAWHSNRFAELINSLSNIKTLNILTFKRSDQRFSGFLAVPHSMLTRWTHFTHSKKAKISRDGPQAWTHDLIDHIFKMSVKIRLIFFPPWVWSSSRSEEPWSPVIYAP